MVERVTNYRLYHVTVPKPYKQPFVPNQSVEIGDNDNPFFGFYESVRQYPVMENGQLVQVKAVRWLTAVRAGRIDPAPGLLPSIAVEVAQHYVMLCRELVMEEIRKSEFDAMPPSRQRCIFACETLESARAWQRRLGGEGTICELICAGKIHRADARLLLGDSEPLSVTRERARAYWRGEIGEDPELELLFVGKAVVNASGL